MISAHTILKRLSVFSLIILCLPFFQTCSDKNILENPYLKNSPLSEVTRITVSTSDSLNQKEITVEENRIAHDSTSTKEYHLTFDELRQKKINAITLFKNRKKEMTSNGYELASGIFYDSSQLIFLPFTLVMILGLLLIFSTYKEKLKLTLVLSLTSFCFLIIPLILLYKAEFLEDIEQIKLGYYLFAINLIFISYLSFKQFRINKNGI